eukprot:365973-Chlamydomonas_euryale.AAC.15
MVANPVSLMYAHGKSMGRGTLTITTRWVLRSASPRAGRGPRARASAGPLPRSRMQSLAWRRQRAPKQASFRA